MQIYVLASIALVAISSVHAGGVTDSIVTNSTSSGSGMQEAAEAGIDSVVTYNTLVVADWEACTEEVGCETETSVCVRHSKYYAQCKPAELPSGDLCGQSDGTNEWLYDHCPSGENCDTKGSDFRCVKPGTRRHHHHKRSDSTTSAPTTVPPTVPVADWKDCTKAGSVCQTATSTCVKHSPNYSQCMPATLPTGGLCGQNDGTSVWKYDGHCTAGETCKATGSDFRCTASPKTTDPPQTTKTPSTKQIADWGNCSKAGSVCKIAASTCVKHSTYYSQCTPATLPTGGLCGQSDGTNEWKYNHCITGETCKANGKDFRCSK